MSKRLTAKIGEYEKDGQTKGRYVNVGVIMQSNDGGEYVLLDPTVSLSGIMAQQNTLAMQKGEQLRDRIMVSVFEDQQQAPQNAQQYNQQQGYQPQQQAPQQYAPRPSGHPAGMQHPGGVDPNSDIPFASYCKGYETVI